MMSLVEQYPDTALFECQLQALGYKAVAGIDEVGRGALAGPVYACAVILPEGALPENIRDSKRISEKKRIRLAEELRSVVTYAFGIVEAERIDDVNILEATKLAMQRAVEALDEPADYLLVDALNLQRIAVPQHALIQGDRRSVSIAAASIIAKAERDAFMVQCDEKYPGYGFARHKGYGTEAHRAAIVARGPSPIHRRTFLRKIPGIVL